MNAMIILLYFINVLIGSLQFENYFISLSFMHLNYIYFSFHLITILLLY